MKISKVKLGLCLLSIVIMLGTVTLVVAPPDGIPLWDRFWKVEQPVEVTGDVTITDGTVTVIGGEMKLANLTTTTNTWLGFHLNEYDNGNQIGFG